MKLKKEFADLYEEIKIKDEVEDLKTKREILEKDIKDKFPGILKKHDIDLNKSDIEMFDQGSYKYNTTIKSKVIDRDVAVMIPLDIEKYDDPRKIKGYLRDAIGYVAARTVKIKEPCINVAYYEKDEEWMHIDLPLYAKHDGKIYLARGREYADNYSWEVADPKGLNKDLCDQIKGNAQLRRIIRFIKKWKNEKYANSVLDHEVPPSIGITYLACDHFFEVKSDEGENDLVSLQQTMVAIKNQFQLVYDGEQLIQANITKKLPVEPRTDIFAKMKESSDDYGVTFYKRLSKAVQNLTDAVNVESEHDAGVYVQRVFGADFIIPEKKALVATTQNKKEHNFG